MKWLGHFGTLRLQLSQQGGLAVLEICMEEEEEEDREEKEEEEDEDEDEDDGC